MMKILMIFFSLLFSILTFSSENCGSIVDHKNPDLLTVIFKEAPAMIAMNPKNIVNMQEQNIDERRGCCSHHSGVCGCSNGRAVCCDNTLSPSCGCD